MFLKKKKLSITLMQFKVQIKAGSTFKVEVYKTAFDIVPPEPKKLERKLKADKTQYFLGKKIEVISFDSTKNNTYPTN